VRVVGSIQLITQVEGASEIFVTVGPDHIVIELLQQNAHFKTFSLQTCVTNITNTNITNINNKNVEFKNKNKNKPQQRRVNDEVGVVSPNDMWV